MIKIKNVSIVLDKKFTILDEVNLELPLGKIIGFIGPSGAGKTTLIRAIVGSQKITHGSIEIFGTAAGSSSLRSSVSYMPQELSVYPDLTIQENLMYFATLRQGKYSKKASRQAVAEVVSLVDLTHQTHHLVSDLSGGQKQRVSLAVALLGLPRLIVLDEPTVGLDPILRRKLWALFHQLSTQGITFIISSHSMDEASRCDDLVLIRDGKVLSHSSPDAFLRKTDADSIEEGFIKIVGEKYE